MKKSLCGLFLILFAMNALAFDVIGKQNRIRIDRVGKNVKFGYCENTRKGERCRDLGKGKSYSLEGLLKQRKVESLEAAGLITAEAGILAGTAIYAAWAMPVFGGVSEIMLGQSIAMLGAAYANVAVDVALAAVSRTLNPVAQLRDSDVLNEMNLNDIDVHEKDEQVLKMAESLDIVLNKIH